MMDPVSSTNTCRLCTNQGEDYHLIFASASASISDKINNCLPIVIRPDDGLPSHICSVCLTALNTSDALRSQAIASDEFLRQQLTAVFIKQEEDLSDNETSKKNSTNVFCEICEIAFDDTTNFDDHMERLHASEWICNLCNENFKSSEALLEHKHTNHYKNSSGIEDPEKVEDRQDSDFSEDLSEKEEELVGCGTTVEAPSPCSICEVTTKTEQQRVMHKKFHETRSMYCSRCLRSYPSPYELLRHKQNVHKLFVGQKMRWFCEQCERFGDNPSFLKKHAECKRIKYKCKYCNAEYLKQRELTLHQKVHSGSVSNTTYSVGCTTRQVTTDVRALVTVRKKIKIGKKRARDRISTKGQWTDSDLKNAFVAVNERNMSIRTAAMTYNVPYSTLRDRIKNGINSGPCLGRHNTFTQEQESSFASEISVLAELFNGVTSEQVCVAAYDYAEKHKIPHNFNPETKKAGRAWFEGFIKRNWSIGRTYLEPSLEVSEGCEEFGKDEAQGNCTATSDDD